MQALQSPPAASIVGFTNGPERSYPVPQFAPRPGDPFGLCRMIEQVSKARYKCPACEVQGVGSACWVCGMTEGLEHTGLSWPTDGYTVRGDTDQSW